MIQLNKNCFTLVEMLVVVAVITVLASLLFPAMRGAKAEAHATICHNNLKQVGSALLTYADADNGWCPRESLDSYGVGSSWMQRMIPEYLPVDNGLIGDNTDDATSIFLQCPVAASINAYWQSCYALNYKLSGTHQHDPLQRLAMVKSPSETMLAMDGIGCWRRVITPDELQNDANRATYSLSSRVCRHPILAANVIYCDGSVGREKSAFLKSVSSDSGGTDKFWNPFK